MRIGLQTGLMAVLLRAAVELILLLTGSPLSLNQPMTVTEFAFTLLVGGLAGYWALSERIGRLGPVIFSGAAAGASFGLIRGLALGAARVADAAPGDLTDFLSGREGNLLSAIPLLLLFMLLITAEATAAGVLGALPMPWIHRALESEGSERTSSPAAGPTSPTPPASKPAASRLPDILTIPQELHPAYESLQAGDRSTAARAIARYLQSDMNSETGWLMMGIALVEPARKRESFSRVLKMNPGNALAASMLAELTPSGSTEPAPFPTPHRTSQAGSQDSSKPSPTRQHFLTLIGLLIIFFVPLTWLFTDPRKINQADLDTFISITACLLSAAVSIYLLARREIALRVHLVSGVINGAMAGFTADLTFAIAYHTVFLPMLSGETKLQGILRYFSSHLLGALFIGLLAGGLASVLVMAVHLGGRRLRPVLENQSAENAWASSILALVERDPLQKRAYISQALTLQPENWLARRMLGGSSRREAAAASRNRSEVKAARPGLPPLFTTALGGKFIRRVAYLLLFLAVLAVIELVRGGDSTIATILAYSLCCIAILAAGSLLIWYLVQSAQRVQEQTEGEGSDTPDAAP
jgi:hypothetical protein